MKIDVIIETKKGTIFIHRTENEPIVTAPDELTNEELIPIIEIIDKLKREVDKIQ